MKNRFYLACFRDNVGSNVSFQRKEFKGYHTDIDQAHECTLEEAQWEFNHAREYDLPISADHVDALAVWKVDCQYIPKETQPFTDIHNTYVAFEKGIWDGNDVYWLISENQNTSTDFDQAYVMGMDKAKKLSSKFVVIPFDLANKSKRRTFDFRKVDKRTMVQGAGLKTPEHLKKAKRKSLNPMTRFNCPGCGKINWQHNPYDFEVCNHCCHHGDAA
ncbi:hypothetical protein D7V64_16860 [Acinetobacter cumulans]|uniref:Uncharacterized protein n=1 Tax=Acinetobacter cumulans TaxID=2136182 RepID=A0A3A8G340_9GAMM|nr:hypothetical protein [Acinetobacter cumulans]RKG47333.1 hypothetical protein D7V64_16860 [Acinetobacter cumulans]